ncbi:MAG: hypothetical protein JWP01_2756 [Myxococcales bacterium]|nr:hypothetical protein [Myxococcales bacterium]
MGYLLPLLCILGGVLAASSMIVAKRPEARDVIAKLQPFQAVIGAGLLAAAVYVFLIEVGPVTMFKAFAAAPVLGLCLWAMVLAAIALGVMFGMPIVAKLSAGGAAKGEEMARTIAPFQALIGLVAIGAGLLGIALQLGIVKPF